MRLVWLWGIVHVLICSRAVPAAAPVEAKFASAEELSHTFSQTYTNTQDAVDVALRLLHSLVADAPDTGECGLAWDILGPTKFTCDTREMRESSSLSLVQRLRLLVASSFDKIINKHPKRPRAAHTLYDSPPVRLWPDWDVDKEKARLFDDWHGEPYLQYRPWPIINGWEQAMWGPFVGPIHDARAPFIEHMEENITNAYTNKALIEFMLGSRSQYTEHQTPMPALLAIRTRAIQLLEWVAYPPDDDTSVDAMLRASFAFSNETSRAQADALWILGEHYFWGTHGSAPNMTKAYRAYERLSKTGNATAHSRLGYMHSSPFLAKVYGFKGSDTDAIVHLALATQEGDWLASNAMGYRLMHGIGTSANCTESLVIFDHLARRSHEVFEQGPPGGRTLPYSKVRLSDRMRLSGPSHQLASGQGFKAFFSVVPFSYYRTQAIIKKDMNAMFDQVALDELMDQYSYLAHEDPIKQFEYASALYFGSIYGYRESLGAIRPNPELAAHHALSLATSRWPIYIKLAHIDDELYRDGYPDKMLAIMSQSSAHAYAARNAAVLLGVMYLRGEGVPQDFKKAKVWLTRAAHEQQPLAMSYLGMMYANGYGGLTPNMTRAWNLFKNSHEKSTLSLLEIAKQHISTYGR